MALLAVPRAATRGAQLCDNLAKLLEVIGSRRSVIRHQKTALRNYSLITITVHAFQIRQSERCVPNSEISPEDFLLT